MTNSIDLFHYVWRECELHGVAIPNRVSFSHQGIPLDSAEALPWFDEEVIHWMILPTSICDTNWWVISIWSVDITSAITRYHVPIISIKEWPTEVTPYKIRDSKSFIVSVRWFVLAALFIWKKEIYVSWSPLIRREQDITIETFLTNKRQ